MSATVILLPLAVALCVSAAETIGMVKDYCAHSRDVGEGGGIQTRFNDQDILVKTLREHGVEVELAENGSIYANCPEGRLVYRRESEDEAYKIYLEDVKNVEGLVCDIELLENEYGLNVQSYTYHKILENMDPTMHVESERVLEDGSILLTISLD